MQVFISHHTESDSALAHKLAYDLQQSKINVWIAPDSIPAGESFVEHLSRGLEESTHIVILLTHNAVESPWIRHEVAVAIDRERKNKIKLIPLEIEDCEVPALWSIYQRISFQNYEQGFKELQKTLISKKPGNKGHLPPRSKTTNSKKSTISYRNLTEVETYAQLYDALYPKLPGDFRNNILNSVIVDQVYLLSSSNKFQAEVLHKMFNRGTAGYRIIALLLLQTNPSADGFNLTLETIANPISPFEQYHGLRSAALITHLLSSSQVKRLSDVLDEARKQYLIPVNRSRWEEYQHILHTIDDLQKVKKKKTKLLRKSFYYSGK